MPVIWTQCWLTSTTWSVALAAVIGLISLSATPMMGAVDSSAAPVQVIVGAGSSGSIIRSSLGSSATIESRPLPLGSMTSYQKATHSFCAQEDLVAQWLLRMLSFPILS